MTEAVSRTDIVLPGSVDENYYPGPDYEPTVFDGGYPHGNQIHPHDIYKSVMGPVYEWKLTEIGGPRRYDWVRIDDGKGNIASEDQWW